MKRLTPMLALALPLFAYAVEIKVFNISPDGDIERSLVLKTQLPEKVVLDCQSFINGLRIGEYEGANYFMMDPDECDGLQDRVKKSLKLRRKHCIQVEADIESDYSC